MRADMKKVLCERPRAGHSRCYHEVRAAETSRDYDDLPACQGMRRPYRDYDAHKELTDHIQPLMRFLHGCVGRRWDDVWSEISQVVGSGNTIDQHLLGHVSSEIETKTYMAGGKICSGGYDLMSGLYVDPRDGIVYIQPEKRPAWKEKVAIVVVDGLSYRQGDYGLLHPYEIYGKWHPSSRHGRYLLKVIDDQRAMHINGIWYWIISADVPPPIQVPYVKDDKVKYRTVYHPRFDFVRGDYVQEGRYYSYKRQMCSRDLRRHGLRNP